MNRITRRFQELRRAGRKALIPYITAGDPHPESTVPMLHALVRAGVDIIELGVPFSDPMADGPVIQKACERALTQGMSLRGVLELVREFRQTDAETPLVLMGYLNPIESMGYDAFVTGARDAGVDGVLTVDLPPEEAAELAEPLKAAGIAPIFLLAPTSSSERIRQYRRAGARLSLLRLAEGRHRFGGHQRRRGGGKTGGDPGLHRSAAGRRFRYQRPADRRRYCSGRRCGGSR